MLPSDENKPWQPNSRPDWIEQRSNKPMRPSLIASGATPKEGENFWEGTDHKAGLAILILVIVQAVAGYYWSGLRSSSTTNNHKRRQRVIECHGNVIFWPLTHRQNKRYHLPELVCVWHWKSAIDSLWNWIYAGPRNQSACDSVFCDGRILVDTF